MISLFLLVLVPVVIHLLVRAQARVIDFPSLRFLRASPMRASRRRLLSDPALLAVRMAIVAAAAAAFAGLRVTPPWQPQAWNARVARAVVVDSRVTPAQSDLAGLGPAFATTRIDADDPGEGVRRGLAWLATAPPARRELVVISDFAFGSIDRLGLDQVPDAVGLRLVRGSATHAPTPVELRTLRIPGPTGHPSSQFLRVTTEDERTRVRSTSSDAPEPGRLEDTLSGVRLPGLALELVGSARDQKALRAVAVAVLQLDVPVSSETSGRHVIVATPGAAQEATLPRTRGLCAAWMGEVAHAVAIDPDITADRPASQVRARADAPWVVVRRDAGGEPIVSLAARDGEPCTLLVDAALGSSSVELPLLVRSVLRARAPARAYEPAESLRAADADLNRWSRPPSEVRPEDVRSPGRNRRWWWLAVMGLLVAEWWMRQRSRTPSVRREVHEPAA